MNLRREIGISSHVFPRSGVDSNNKGSTMTMDTPAHAVDEGGVAGLGAQRATAGPTPAGDASRTPAGSGS